MNNMWSKEIHSITTRIHRLPCAFMFRFGEGGNRTRVAEAWYPVDKIKIWFLQYRCLPIIKEKRIADADSLDAETTMVIIHIYTRHPQLNCVTSLVISICRSAILIFPQQLLCDLQVILDLFQRLHRQCNILWFPFYIYACKHTMSLHSTAALTGNKNQAGGQSSMNKSSPPIEPVKWVPRTEQTKYVSTMTKDRSVIDSNTALPTRW